MMIFSMNLEVLGKIVDALTQERDLHFRRAGIALMDPELLDDPLLLLWSNSHVSAFSLFPCLMSMFSNIVTCYCKAATTPKRLQGRAVDSTLYVYSGHRSAREAKDDGKEVFLPRRYATLQSRENLDCRTVAADRAPRLGFAPAGSGFLSLDRPERCGSFHR